MSMFSLFMYICSYFLFFSLYPLTYFYLYPPLVLYRTVMKTSQSCIVPLCFPVLHLPSDRDLHLMYYSPQARIKEFSSEGVQLSENLDKPKKSKRGGRKTEEKTEGCMWWFFQFCRRNRLSRQLSTWKFFSVGHGLLYNCKPLSPLYTNTKMTW